MTSGKGKSVDTVKRLVVARNFKGAVGVRRMSNKSTDNFYSMRKNDELVQNSESVKSLVL